MPIPARAHRISEFISKDVLPSSPTSGHEVWRVTFREKEGEKGGFYKPLSANYPAILAKYCVAVSVWLRMMIGQRASEERLVYDDEDRLVGTLSLAMPDFKPLLCFADAPPVEPGELEMVNPRTATLLQHNFAEILVASWVIKDDDGHPRNRSLTGMIDMDMALYHITYLMKGARVGVDGVIKDMPQKALRLTPRALDNFPAIDGPTHWPTYSLPWNYNFTKRYASVEAFLTLARNPSYGASMGVVSFHEQMFQAFLKILVCFDKEQLNARLQDYLGDVPLDYESLTDGRASRLAEAYPLFFNAETNRQSFIAHILEVFRVEYDELYRAVVFYDGCKANRYGVSVPSFNVFLRHFPSAFMNVLQYAQMQNDPSILLSPSYRFRSRTSSVLTEEAASPAEKPDERLFCFKTMESRYHQIWRDTFLFQVKDLLKRLSQLLSALKGDLASSRAEAGLDEEWAATEAWHVLDKVALPDASPRAEVCGMGVRHAYQALWRLASTLKHKTDEYYRYQGSALTEERNTEYLYAVQNAIRESEDAISRALLDRTYRIQFSAIMRGFDELMLQMHFPRHLRSEDKPLLPSVTPETATFLHIDHTEKEVMKSCLQALFDWAQTIEGDLLNTCILTIMHTDYGTSGNRVAFVQEYIKATTDNGADKLAFILSDGGTVLTSLNTKLIVRLIPMMLDALKDSIDIHLLSIRRAFDENRFAALAYAAFAKEYARTNERFTHLYAKSTLHRFCNFLMNWVERKSREEFAGLIQASYLSYSGSSWLRGFWSNRRDLEANEFLKDTRLSNREVLMKILAKGETQPTSLNTLIFQVLVDKMREDYTVAQRRLEPDYPILSRLAPAHYLFYVSALQNEVRSRLAAIEREPEYGSASAGMALMK